MRYTRKTGHGKISLLFVDKTQLTDEFHRLDYAERYSIGTTHPRRTCLITQDILASLLSRFFVDKRETVHVYVCVCVCVLYKFFFLLLVVVLPY
jgi:hypothetical protein